MVNDWKKHIQGKTIWNWDHRKCKITKFEIKSLNCKFIHCIPWQMWVAWCLHDFHARGHHVCSWALDTSLLRNLSAPWCTFVNGTAGDNPAMDYMYCSIPSTGRRNTVTSCYWIYKRFIALAWWLLDSYADLDRASHCMLSTSCRLFGSRTRHKDSNTAVLNLSH